MAVALEQIDETGKESWEKTKHNRDRRGSSLLADSSTDDDAVTAVLEHTTSNVRYAAAVVLRLKEQLKAKGNALRRVVQQRRTNCMESKTLRLSLLLLL